MWKAKKVSQKHPRVHLNMTRASLELNKEKAKSGLKEGTMKNKREN